MTYAELVDLSSGLQQYPGRLRRLPVFRVRALLLSMPMERFWPTRKKKIEKLENHLNRPEVQEARLKGKGDAVRYSSTTGVDMLYVAVPVKTGQTITAYVRLARPLYDVSNTIKKVYNSFFLGVLVVAFLSLIIALLFSRRLAAPIKAMEKFTERLRSGDTSGTIFINTSDETKTLADNINYLVEELNSKIRLANEESGKLVTAFASMTEGVMILDAADRIEVVNRAMNNILAAMQYGNVTGRTLMEVSRNVDLQQAFLMFKKTREPVLQEITLGSSLQPVMLTVSISGIKGDRGSEKTMIVFHDVTRLKKLERLKIDFVANVTHEIRTPLTAILGYLETIRDGAIENPEEARKFIDIILKHAQRLNRLVEDLLTISKIELGEIKFNFENASLADALSNVLPLIEPKARLKNIEVGNVVSEKLPLIKADKDRLAQIFVNIMDNAVKFTPENGKVSVDAKEVDGSVVVEISDTGIGIPKEEIERLGERFYRVDKKQITRTGRHRIGPIDC